MVYYPAMRTVKRIGYVCERCGHVTVTRDGKPPICCGGCKDPRWFRPRKKK